MKDTKTFSAATMKTIECRNHPMQEIWAFCLPIFLFLSLPASLPALGSQKSADYNFSNESTDGGGLRTASPDYIGDGSFCVGSYVASTNYVQRGGYVAQLNNAPVAANYTFTVVSNTNFKISVNALLSAATDPDGDSISFVNVANFSAENSPVAQDGLWVLYQAPSGFTGTDSFTWVIQDSEGDRATGVILAQVSTPPPPPGQPTLNLISVIFDPAPGATDATLQFASLPQSSYTVQYTDSIIPPVAWTTLGTVTTTNGVLDMVDPSAGAVPQRFYRTVFLSP